jgi:hypothetical protein
MTTKHKWLPNEPTDEIIESMMLKTPADCDINEVWLKGVYKAILDNAPDVEQEIVAYLVTIQRHNRLDSRLVYKLEDLVLNEVTRIVSYEPLFSSSQPLTVKQEPVAKREPLSGDALNYVLSHFPESVCNFEAIELVRLVEKTLGIE